MLRKLSNEFKYNHERKKNTLGMVSKMFSIESDNYISIINAFIKITYH